MEKSTSAPLSYVCRILLVTLTILSLPQIMSAQCLGSIELNVVAAPEPTIEGDALICPGETTTLSVAGGPYSTYQWSTNSPNPTISVNTSGTYSVVVSNATGCTSEAEFDVTVLDPPTPTITELPYQCNGEITLDAGAGFSTYAWNTGGNEQTITVTAGGSYSVTVTNAGDCTGTATYELTIPSPPSVDITGEINYCAGESTTLTATAGFVSYAWTGGSPGQSIIISNPGTYGVTVTDAFGCTAEASVVVTEFPFTPPTINDPDLLCPGSTISLSAEGGPYTGYVWSNSLGTSPSVSVSNPGTYTVTVTAANGCTGIASQTVNTATLPDPEIIGDLAICDGISTILSVTPTFINYNWSTTSTEPSITVNTPGPYSVTVTNTAGCTAATGVNVIPGTPPQVTIIPIASPLCLDDPAINLVADPSGGVWGGDVGPSGVLNPSALGPGAFTATYTFTDAEGCTGTDELPFIIQPVVLSSIEVAGPFCTSDPIQTLTGSPAGGIWGGIADAAGQIDPSVLAPGIYSVTYSVAGSGFCSETAEIFVEILTPPSATIQGSGIICEDSGQSLSLILSTTGNGPFVVTYTIDGNSPTTLAVDEGISSINASEPGTYEILSIVDANACSGSGSGQAIVETVDAPVITNFILTCDGAQENYTATFEITGGDPTTYNVFANLPGGNLTTTPPYIYTSPAIPSGDSYQFVINDINDCNPTTLSGTFSCDCLTDAGTMNTAALNLCEETTATATHLGDETLDGNDVLLFVLHDGSGNTLGNIFGTNSAPEFDFAAPLVAGNTYYISAIAGNADGSGGIDLDDPCLSVSIGTPVTWQSTPSGSLAIEAEVCEGEAANLLFSLSGNPPFDLTYSDGNQSFDLTNVIDGQSISVSPTSTTTYTLLTINDNSNPACSASPNTSVTVIVNPTVTVNANVEICEGESVLLAGTLQTAAGIFTDTLSTSIGCDSIIITTLSVNPIDTTELFDTSCDPAQTGIFTDIFTNQNGCDSTVITTITFSQSDSTFISDATCDPNLAGVFTENLINQIGCDSIVTTIVSLLASDTTELFDTSCDPAQTGIFTDIFTNQNGCDSTVITTITFSASDSTFISDATCDPNLAGVFTENLINQLGCDSIITTTVSLLASDTTQLFDTSCDPAQTGIFTDIFTNQNGCDSTVITTITFSQSDSTFISDATCDPNLAGVFTENLINQIGCDSIVTTTVSLLASDTTQLFDTSCDPAQTGIFTDIFTNQNGCDSTVITIITFSASDSTFISDTTCDPNLAGVFTENLINQLGCDSIITTTVSLLASDTTQLFDTSCDPAQTGVFTDILTNQNGCDSTVITIITFSASDSTFISDTTCDPNLAGVFTENLINQLGCDSIITTTVSLLASDTTQLFDTSCDPAQTGVFTDIFTNQNGCDSTIITTITFSSSDSTFISDATCDPNLAGVFTENLINQIGCDSIVTTTVSLLASDTTELFDTSCDPAQTGVFTDILINQNGCDSTVITTIAFSQSDSTFISDATCDPNLAGVFTENLINQIGCDSIVTTIVSLLASDTTQLFNTSCDPAQTGVFTDILTNQNGCDSTVITTITFSASDSTFISDATCDPNLAGVFTENLINQLGCDSIITTTVSLLASDTTQLFDTSCDPAQTGVFTDILINQNGCDSVVITTISLLPLGDCTLAFLLTGEPIPCDENNGTLTLEIIQGNFPIQYTYTGNNGENGNGTIDVSPLILGDIPPGEYNFTLVLASGVSASQTLVLEQASPPQVDIAIVTPLDCQNDLDGVITATATGDYGPYFFDWSNGETEPTINGLGAGSYALTVSDDLGCEVQDSVELTGAPPPMLAFAVNPPDCFDVNGGQVIAEASGSEAPYLYALNDGIFQENNTFSRLSAGAYEVTVQSAAGCSTTESFAINAPIPVEVDLGDDLQIELGDEVVLTGLVNISPELIQSIDWSGLENPECPNCLDQNITPLVTSAYSISVVSEAGCIGEDGLTIIVDRRRQIFFPNVFSPNGDANNERFFPFAKAAAVKQVNTFRIFSRWGEKVYEATNFQPNDPAPGWDGRFHGELLNPAVFVWLAEIEFIDGSVELFSGDVTLVR